MKAKQRRSKEQKLRDAVADTSSALKEAGDPLRGMGPNAQYADAFDRHGQALKALLAHECPLHVADWSWDGYEGNFHFWWDFGTAVTEAGSKYDWDTRFVHARCSARLDPSKPLDEELSRLHAEAVHYDELRREMQRWTSARAKATRDLTAA